jgi:hypothetical protein
VETHLHAVLANLGGQNVKKDVVGYCQQAIPSIHGIAMPENRLPDLALNHCVLYRLETDLCHGSSSTR